MNDLFKKVLIIFFAGWVAGYFHHYFAGRAHVAGLEAQSVELSERVRMLEASVSTVEKVFVKTTAYSNDPVSIDVPRWRDRRTATNKHVKRGMVAADWRVFPPGTRLFIPGYGEAVVEDRGGAVKGYHLDLFVDSYDEALRWGVREMGVYVLARAAS